MLAGKRNQDDLPEIDEKLGNRPGRLQPDSLDSSLQADFTDGGGFVLIPGAGAFDLETECSIPGGDLGRVPCCSPFAGPLDGHLVFTSGGNCHLPDGKVIFSPPHPEVAVALLQLEGLSVDGPKKIELEPLKNHQNVYAKKKLAR